MHAIEQENSRFARQGVHDLLLSDGAQDVQLPLVLRYLEVCDDFRTAFFEQVLELLGEVLTAGTLLDHPQVISLQVPWFKIDVPVDLRFVPVAVEKAHVRPSPSAGSDDDDDGREMNDEDPSIVLYDEPRIDLAQVAREQCYLAMPMKPLCRPECQGLCVQCGSNRNVTTCTCENRWEDPRLAGLKSLLKDAGPQAPRE